jgi:UDP-3-O-[3-hydroxymyristoyl] N-acetylglucosamine deacetylase
MDGMPRISLSDLSSDDNAPRRQRTLKAPIGCVGVGVHSGKRACLTLKPAEAGHGIVFRRTDPDRDFPARDLPARFDHVVDTRMSTVLGDLRNKDVRVGTVEHLMAALAGAGVDNALIEVDGPEVPILDGSAAPFLFLLECAGLVEQAGLRRILEIRRPVRVTAGRAFAELRPLGPAYRAGAPILELDLSIDFAAEAIGSQSCAMRLTPDNFRAELSRARTFALSHEVDHLRAAGLGLGGSLDNAVVVDGAKVLNPGGLRMEHEFVRHKLLDAVGDLALAGAPIHGRFVAHRTGHTLNNRLLRALFDDASAWREIVAEPMVAAAA